MKGFGRCHVSDHMSICSSVNALWHSNLLGKNKDLDSNLD